MNQGQVVRVFFAFAFAYFLSTLVRAITATLSPTAGEITYRGRSVLGQLRATGQGSAIHAMPEGHWKRMTDLPTRLADMDAAGPWTPVPSPLAMAEQLKQGIAHASFRVIPHAKHLTPLETSDVVAQALEPLLTISRH